ncbi:SRPBCC family protein [Nocardia sp. NPDC050793]|uniref:SRPBCC family protein n=1 Tax=Nocardia sp. NPDC050793 TaxID=3155159 RepID=UPI0033DBAF9D
MSESRCVQAERIIDAPAEVIFDVLADPRRHCEIDGSGSVHDAVVSAPERLSANSTFAVRMRVWPPDAHPASLLQVAVAIINRGRISNTVTEFDEPHAITWRNDFGRHTWRYELHAVPGSPGRTLVRETFDYSANLLPPLLELVGFPGKNRNAMRHTLDRLAAAVGTTV